MRASQPLAPLHVGLLPLLMPFAGQQSSTLDHVDMQLSCGKGIARGMRLLSQHGSLMKQVSTRAMPSATLAGAAAALAAAPGAGAPDAPVSQRFKAQVQDRLPCRFG